jgi:hypothetical protein
MLQPLVYIIVLNYNGRRWIEACFESIYNTKYDNYCVILVDNASDDGSVDFVRSRFNQVVIIENAHNIGFSEGNNIGIRRAIAEDADYVILLNPDTKVEPEWLGELVAVGEAEDFLGILGAVQLEYDGMKFNNWTANAASEYLEELKDLKSARAWIPMEWVEGACFAVKRKVFEEVGLLDPIYFAFYEEIDFCRRAASHGYNTALVPRSRIHHYRGGSWEADPSIKRERDYICDRSQFIYAATDPRKSLAHNLGWYLVTLGTKVKETANDFSLAGMSDLIRMQFELMSMSGSIVEKWQRDRVRHLTAK